MNPPDWQTDVEIHPRDWICPAVPFWVAGWARSPSGLIPRDIRARCGHRVFLGLCGLPRPDRENPPGPPGAGFSFYLPPVAGARDLVIELCDQHGRWTEIFRHSITGMPSSEATPAAANNLPDNALLLDLLRAKHARPHESWSTLADELLLGRRGEFVDIMPSEPFKGALEQLEFRLAVHYDHVLITGWVAHRSQRITRLTAFLDSAAPQPLLHGLDQPDAGQMFGEFADAARSRFAGYLRLPADLPRPVAVRIFAETADGQNTLVFLKRFRPVLLSAAGTDLPPVSRWRFLQAARTLNRAVWRCSWFDPSWRGFLAGAWLAYRAEAPARRLPKAGQEQRTEIPSGPLRITLVTHNLNFEGAPLFLQEFACHLCRQPGVSVRVVSACAGPLAERYAAAGIDVNVQAPDTAPDTADDRAFAAALDRLGHDPVWKDADLIVANTLVAFWAVPLAHRLGKPNVLYLHESAGARRFFALDFPPAAIARVEQAIASADRVVFPAADGQRAHGYLGARGHFRALPGWVDVARIDSYLQTHDRRNIRSNLDLSPDAVVFAHIGSFIARKGVHVFVEAIRGFVQHARADVTLAFLLVGAKADPDPYAELVQQAVADIAGADIRIIPQSSDPYGYFLATDVFVCASLEEVFPRVVLEAAAFGRNIVSTNVNGIPEMLGPAEAWLVPPDDAPALAQAMDAALKAHQRGDRSKPQAARRRVAAHFDTTVMLPRHTALIRRVAGGVLD
jgi:glycosyltransferase involved in cell wall biosynthesis